MKLQERLPDRITVGKRVYRVDLDFRNVLRMMEIMGRDDLIPEARDYLALRCVMKRPPKDAAGAMAVLTPILFQNGKRRGASEQDQKRLTDFVQDADMIRAAFLQVYGINLWRDRLHWLEFTALLSSLPEGTRYTEVVGIRARPIPAGNQYNQAEREWLINAKRVYALETDDEQSAALISSAVGSLAQVLISMAEQGKEVRTE